MRLLSFSVTNYRSITAANRIPMGNETILLGKNNEGKSNILWALDLTMNLILSFSGNLQARRIFRNQYSWDRDFPVQFRESKSISQSIFRMKFGLNDEEIQDFYREIGTWLNGELDIEIKIGKTNNPNIYIPKRGKYTTSLKDKIEQITSFISNRIGFAYIPTIRTDQDVLKIINEMTAEVLQGLYEDEEYQKAQDIINTIQNKKMLEVAKKVKEQLGEFLPKIKSVSFTERERLLRSDRYSSNYDLIIDDGVPTSIKTKGDGVKSLAALAMYKSSKSNHKDTVYAIEEPESHLHPAAIHQLKQMIKQLAENDQILISTHNPLFVTRKEINSNIIVNNGEAKPADSIQQIRDLLGVQVSDNLVNSKYILVVEGEDDKISLKKILPALSQVISKAFDNDVLKIEEIGGASNLSYKLASLNNQLCIYHVLLDNDKAGRDSFEKAKKENLIDVKNVTFTNCQGMSNSEFEDCLNTDFYKDILKADFGVDISINRYKKGDKWSCRIEESFHLHGKPFDDTVLKEVKLRVAHAVPTDADLALNKYNRNSIDALVNAIKTMIDEK